MILFWMSWVLNAALAGDRFYNHETDGSPALALIQSAKKSIDIEIYTMTDLQIQAAIQAAVSKGVKVRVVQEPSPFGVSCKVFEAPRFSESSSCQKQRELVKFVQDHGGIYTAFNTRNLCGVSGSNCFQHGKIIVADSAMALISTGNFDATNLCDSRENPEHCNRDYSVVTNDSSVVATLQAIFEKDVVGSPFDLNSLLSRGSNRVTVSPLSLSPLVNFIRSARKSVQVQNQYLKEPQINAALIEVAKRGVQVQVMVESVCGFGSPDAYNTQQWTQTFSAFDSAGITSKIFTGNMRIENRVGYLHAKTIVVDGSRAWVGSVNGSTMSVSNNREYGLFLNDAASIRALATQMSRDFNHPNAETWKESLACQKDAPISGE